MAGFWKQWLKSYKREKLAEFKPPSVSSVSGDEAETAILSALGDFYNMHPALYTEIEELSQISGITIAELSLCLESLESRNLVAIYRTRHGIRMAKATYEGLRKAYPPEHYRKYPDFVNLEKEVF